MLKKLFTLIAIISFISAPVYANSQGSVIDNVAEKVAQRIGTSAEYLLNNEDQRAILSLTIGVYSTLYGPSVVSMIPGVYTSIVASYELMDELFSSKREVEGLKDDAYDVIIEGQASTSFEDFAKTVRSVEGAEYLTDKQIASMLLSKSVIG